MTRLTFLISLLSPLAFWRKPAQFRCHSSLRNLGLTDIEISQRALNSCSRWLACGQHPQFDFSEMFIKPGELPPNVANYIKKWADYS